MKKLLLAFSLLLLVVVGARAQGNMSGDPVSVRAGIKHDAYDKLLKKYVNERGLVNYSVWKANASDMTALNDYLKQFAAPAEPAASGNERAATLANGYNAFVLQWILANYPTDSIWQLKDSFKAKRHAVGGRMVALNDIEHGALRPSIGYRAHAILVCAARSCPPLQRDAYAAGSFDAQDAHAFTAWLGRDDMNQFFPKEKRVEISSIFKWFKSDFEKAGGVPKILGRYAPENVHAFAGSGAYEIKYKGYNWGLNDQGAHGRHYSKTNLIFDNIFH